MATNISSIHIQPTHIGEFFHNTREKSTVNSICDSSKNYYDKTGFEALKLYEQDLEQKKKLYYEKHKRSLPSNTKTLFSAIVNLKENSTIQDVEKVANYLKEKLGVTIYQIAIHEDEGHFENDKFIKNRHAHIIFSGLDKNARSIKRNKLNIHFLRQLQDDVAKILKMQRGRSRKIGERKRLNTYEYKKAVKNLDNNIQELKQKFKLDKTKIQKYTKIFDNWLNEYVGFFNKIKKDDVLKLFTKFLTKMNNTISHLEKENKQLKEQLSNIKIEHSKIKYELEQLKKENEFLKKEAQKIIEKTKQLDSVKILTKNKKLEKENKELKITIKKLKELISELRKQMIELNKQLNEHEKIFSKEDYQYLSKLKKDLKKETLKEIYEEFMQYKQQTLQKAKNKGLDIDL